MPGEPGQPLSVVVTHEPFLGEPFNPIFKLEYNGQSEELDHRDALVWFKQHGARNEDKVNSVLNQAANFGIAEVSISTPVFPTTRANPRAPRI
jgi:hypothetical protein